MTIKGKNVGPRFSDKKWDLAMKAEMFDYIKASKHSNMFLAMTKEEERNWEATTINEYYRNYTIKQLETIVANKKAEWENNYKD